MPVYRTAQGKMVDMTALAARNQKTRAVGNMNVNARGDTIDSFGKVITPVTEKVSQKYGKTVGNRSAHAVKASSPNIPKPKASPTFNEELTEYEKELVNELENDEKDLEIIKAKETGKK